MAVTIADFVGGFEDGDPDEFAFEVGIAEVGGDFFRRVLGGGDGFGDDAIGFAQKFEKGDESVEAEGENFGGGETFGAESEFAQGAIVPSRGGKKGEDDFAGGLGHGFSR